MVDSEGVKEVRYSTKEKVIFNLQKKKKKKIYGCIESIPTNTALTNYANVMCVFKVDIFQEGHISDTLFQYFSVKINISYGNRIMMTVQSGEVMVRFECLLLRHCSIKGAKILEESQKYDLLQTYLL